MVYVWVGQKGGKCHFEDYRFKWDKEYSLDCICQTHIDGVQLRFRSVGACLKWCRRNREQT
jgi:hypothetical protein